jgi:large subunit ribosomal protein L10
MMAHIAEWKFREVKELKELINKHRVIGVVGINGIPAPQMQQMRKNLHKTLFIRSAKNRLIFKALDELEKEKKGILELKNLIRNQTAIIATEMNPFKLFQQIKGTRTMAPAKGGETIDHNIHVKSGETPFKPGPIVGELQKAGIPAAIQDGKVVIKNDKVIVTQGQKIPSDVAQMLTRLEIFPIEIGMNLYGVYEGGSIFKPDVLDIDIDEFVANIKTASVNALNLAIQTAWSSKDTIKSLIVKAHFDSITLAVEQGITSKETIKRLISKANMNMLAIKKITS